MTGLLTWQQQSLIERIRWLRLALPPVLVLVVILYQLGVAQSLERNYGHLVHYSVEIGFYSLAGPVVTWLTLVWVERRLAEKDRLERQVQAQTRQLASLTAASADAILSLDAAGAITSWNRGAERTLGYPASEIVGQPLSHLLLEAETLAARLDRDGVVQDFETTARTKDGRTLAVSLTQTRLMDPAGPGDISLIIMRDVTARRARAAILEEERARIARDLHDGVAQTLYFLALKADMLRQQLADGPQQARDELKEIGARTRQVIREVRRTIFALRPLEWSHHGFLAALKRFAAEFGEQAGWQITFEAPEPMPELPHQLEPAVFRLVQESLNNVAKHAGANQVWVTVAPAEGRRELKVSVKDDGRGFDPATRQNGGFGLGQMRARAEGAGGRFEVATGPESGTVVTAFFPLEAESRP